MIKNICLICGETILTYPSKNKRLCSKDCFRQWQSKIRKGKLPKNWHPEIGFKKGKLNPMYGKKPNWKGGRNISRGYIYIYKPKHPSSTKVGYILEHRLVMEKKLGRRLTKEEVVHHIDGNKINNKIENLYLFESRYYHGRYHKMLIELVGNYLFDLGYLKNPVTNKIQKEGGVYECC